MVTEVKATLWEDKFGKRHTTKASAERAETFSDLTAALTEKACYGQLEADDVVAFIDDNGDLIERHIAAGTLLKAALE